MIGVDCDIYDVYDGCGQTSGCSLGHDQIDLGRAILLLNFPTSRCQLPVVVDNHWMAWLELLFRQFSCHTTTAHDSQILRNQLAHILRNQLARIQQINWIVFKKSIGSHFEQACKPRRCASLKLSATDWWRWSVELVVWLKSHNKMEILGMHVLVALGFYTVDLALNKYLFLSSSSPTPFSISMVWSLSTAECWKLTYEGIWLTGSHMVTSWFDNRQWGNGTAEHSLICYGMDGWI